MEERDIGKKTGPGVERVPDPASPRAGVAVGTESRPGPTWRGWVISILVAVVLSVAATVIFGGPFSWRAPDAARSGACPSPCCPPAGR